MSRKGGIFSSVHELEEGYYQEGDYIVRRLDGEKEVILNVHTDMNLVGRCNVENVMAALAMADGMGVPLEVSKRLSKNSGR